MLNIKHGILLMQRQEGYPAPHLDASPALAVAERPRQSAGCCCCCAGIGGVQGQG